ncbi:trypsin-like peptidase domain-containing protein [Actinoplanes sp. NPDC024001]|uniref:trypsin-like peptidase domain-containing protein n=1 Tax=Actinoplanes sp. NPDC024001 TaxID=3154598 RepID=UPI00340FBD64
MVAAKERVVAVLAELPGGLTQIGSGYLVRPGVVVTAEHCTRDKKTGAAAVSLSVIRSTDGERAEVTAVTAHKRRDLAVLDLAAGDWPADPPTGFGRVDRDRSGVLHDCAGIGYPHFQYDERAGARDTAELHGEIYCTDGRETGRLLLREPLLETTGNAFGGLSGALIFHAGLALGVVIEHHPRQGAAAVQLAAFDTLLRDAETDPEAAAVAQRLGLRPDAVLPWARAPLPPSAVHPFGLLDRHAPVFQPDQEQLRPAYDEFLAGSINAGARAPQIERRLDRGSVLVLGDGAAGKTTLGLWIGVRHASRGGTTRYFEMTVDEQVPVPQALDALHHVAGPDSLIIVDDAHLDEDLAVRLHAEWTSMGSPGKLLLLARNVSPLRFPDSHRSLQPVVGHVERMVVDGADLINTASRIVATDLQPPDHAVDHWLTLYQGDRWAFVFAVRQHLEHEGLQRWLRRGARLSASDPVEYVRERYLDRWPEARADVLKLAATAALEFAVPEESVSPGALDGPLRHGIVQRTTHGRHFRRYSFLHSSHGSLVLKAARVRDSELTPMFVAIARDSPASGYVLAGRLEAADREDAAREVVRAAAATEEGLAAALHPLTITANLDRIDRLAGIAPDEVDQRLTDTGTWRAVADDFLEYTLTAMLAFLRESRRRLPRVYALITALDGDELVTHIAETCTTNLGETSRFLAEVPRPLAESVVARLAGPELITEITHACTTNLGETSRFLAELPRRYAAEGAQLAERLLAALADPEWVERIAGVATQNLGETTAFLTDVRRGFPPTGPRLADLVEELLSTPERAAGLADVCAANLGETTRFLTFLPRFSPTTGRRLVAEVVAQLDTPVRHARMADACTADLLEAGLFLVALSRRYPLVAGRLAEALSEPERVARAVTTSIDEPIASGYFWARAGTRWPQLKEAMLRRRDQEPDAADRIAEKIAGNPVHGVKGLHGFVRVDRDFFVRVVESIGPERLARLITANLTGSGWLLHELRHLPELEAETFPLVLRAQHVQSHLQAPEPTAGTVESLIALAAIAARLTATGDPRGAALTRTLLRAFRFGYHLGRGASLRDLAMVAGLAAADPDDLRHELGAALAAVRHSRVWLHREYLRHSPRFLATNLSELWWTCGNRGDVLALGGRHLTERVADDLALLSIARPTPDLLLGVTELLGLLPWYGLTPPAGLPAGLIALRDVPAENLWAAGEQHAMLSGLMVVHGAAGPGPVPPDLLHRLTVDVEDLTVFRHRPDQRAVKQRLRDWLLGA